ncbi:hypothetical protein Tco_0719706 [Tanacetum coccineum]
METNQINIFTQSSTSIDDLLEMDLKLKLLNEYHLNKSNVTHTTHQQIYDTLYESIILDQDALDVQSSFYKRSLDNQDPPNDREGENKKKLLSEAQWNSDERYFSKPRSLERHMLKNVKPHPCFYNKDYTYLVDLSTEEKYTTSITKHYAARYYIEGIEDMIPERWSKEVHLYHLEALNVRRSDDQEYEFSYAGLPRLSVNNVENIRIMIKNKVEDIQLGVESYQRTLNLTKATMFFEENLIDILSKKKLGSSNKRLKGRD